MAVSSAPAATASKLDENAAFRDTWRLYKRLFAKSVLVAAVVFGALNLAGLALPSGRAGLVAGLGWFALTFCGIALLEGVLVELVRDLHEDGDHESSLAEIWGRAGSRLGALVATSMLAALVPLAVGVAGVLVSLVLTAVSPVLGAVAVFVVVIACFAATLRVALAIPVAVLENTRASDAIRRSNELVRGNAWHVFLVLFGVGLLSALVTAPFTIASAGSGTVAAWVGATTAAALTRPLAAHAVTVMYYRRVEPSRPVALDPGHRWASVWAEQDPLKPKLSPREEFAWAEYERRVTR